MDERAERRRKPRCGRQRARDASVDLAGIRGQALYDMLTPGATIIVTDQPAVRKASRDFTILAD
jgi:hypothetical protein